MGARKMKRLGLGTGVGTMGAAVAAVAITVATPALGAEQTWNWSGTIAAGKAIEVKDVNGGIEASGTTGSQVIVTAVKKGRKNDPSEVTIQVVEHAGGVTICAVYPSNGRPNECAPGEGGRLNAKKSDVHVQFEVKVPTGVRFIGRTVNGGITARGIQADAEAHTVNGGVEIEAAGTARAQTVNGGISASLGRADWDGTLKLTTVNGGHRGAPSVQRVHRRQGGHRERRHRDRLPADREGQDRAPQDRGIDRRRWPTPRDGNGERLDRAQEILARSTRQTTPTPGIGPPRVCL